MAYTLLTSVQTAGQFTSTLRTKGRGYVHGQFRVGSAVSAPVISTMSVTMVLQAAIPGADALWCDIQTWAVTLAESMSGRDISYEISEPGVDVRLGVKVGGTNFCQARLWEG